jgi:hypothetical protein
MGDPASEAAVSGKSAQLDKPANRMIILLIRRFRVRAPDAPPRLTFGYALDQDQSMVCLPMKNPLIAVPAFAIVAAFAWTRPPAMQ